VDVDQIEATADTQGAKSHVGDRHRVKQAIERHLGGDPGPDPGSTPVKAAGPRIVDAVWRIALERVQVDALSAMAVGADQQRSDTHGRRATATY
jgi:hypothetical protein